MKINLQKLLSEFDLFLKTLNNITGSKLISFGFNLENSTPLNLINDLSETYDDIFLFKTPNSQLTTIGLNSSFELIDAGANKFSSVVDNYNFCKQNLISNRTDKDLKTSPIIFCSAKFDPNNSSSLWNNFETLRIYVPEFILSFQKNNLLGYYHFILDNRNKFDSSKNKFSKYLELLSKIDAEIQSSLYSISNFSEENRKDFSNWNNVSLKVLEQIKDGEINKLVLSRTYSFNINDQINWNYLLQQLYKRFPDCYLFFIKKNDSIFFGSSPELFLKVYNGTAEVESVAGSAARDVKADLDHELEKYLKTSEKNHREHLFVSDFITNILIKYSNSVRIIHEKQIRKLDNIQHLITKISAELNSSENLFELIDSLFPTPAVCGVPKENAISLIRKLETHDRGLYSGLVGVFDFNRNCELAVSIRSALVKDNQVTAFAGAGLVTNSIPEEEFQETKLKLNTILSLFNDQNKS